MEEIEKYLDWERLWKEGKYSLDNGTDSLDDRYVGDLEILKSEVKDGTMIFDPRDCALLEDSIVFSFSLWGVTTDGRSRWSKMYLVMFDYSGNILEVTYFQGIRGVIKERDFK